MQQRQRSKLWGRWLPRAPTEVKLAASNALFFSGALQRRHSAWAAVRGHTVLCWSVHPLDPAMTCRPVCMHALHIAQWAERLHMAQHAERLLMARSYPICRMFEAVA
jgi:hypothetical protein